MARGVQLPGGGLVHESGSRGTGIPGGGLYHESAGSATNDVSHSFDALLYSVVSQTHSVDAMAYLAGAKTHTFSSFAGSGIVVSNRGVFLPGGGMVHESESQGTPIPGGGLYHQDATAAAAAEHDVAHTIDALLRSTEDVTHSFDTYLQEHERIHTFDALMFGSSSKTHTLDTYLTISTAQVTSLGPTGVPIPVHDLGTAALVEQTLSHTFDSLLRATTDKTHAFDALKKSTPDKIHTFNSLAYTRITKSHTFSSYALATKDQTHSFDALLAGSGALAHGFDTYLQSILTRTHTIDALAYSRLTKSHTFDIFKQGLKTRTHSFDSFIGIVGELLTERFEASPGTDETWSDPITTAGTGDWNPDALASAIGSPFGFNGECLLVDPGDQGIAHRYHQLGGPFNPAYAAFSVYLAADGLASGDEFNAFLLDEAGLSGLIKFGFRKTAGQLQLLFQVYEDGTGVPTDVLVNAAVDTAYRIGLKWDTDAATWEVKVNEVVIDSGAITDPTPIDAQQIRVGVNSAFAIGSLIYFDAIGVSTLGYPLVSIVTDAPSARTFRVREDNREFRVKRDNRTFKARP